jgi:predicted PurR-regulated permease PerM
MNDEVSQAGDGSDILRRLLGVAAVIVIIAGLRSARPVLVPLALATFLVVTSLPILRELRRNRVPDLIAVPLVLMLIVSMLIGVGAIALNSIMQIRDSLPQYVDRLTEMYENTFRWLGEHRIIAPEAAAEIMVSPPQRVELATGFVRSFAGFMSLVVLVTLITLFMLAEAGGGRPWSSCCLAVRTLRGTPPASANMNRVTSVTRTTSDMKPAKPRTKPVASSTS